MSDIVPPFLTLAAAIGSGAVAGVFFAFSSFVMRALGRLAPPEGIRAMQSINIVVLRSGFIATFFATAVLSVVAVVYALTAWPPRAGLLLAGALVYLIGSFGVTVAFNVPRNQALAAVAPTDDASATLWSEYLASWTAWNHVRTAASAAAAVLFTLALRA